MYPKTTLTHHRVYYSMPMVTPHSLVTMCMEGEGTIAYNQLFHLVVWLLPVLVVITTVNLVSHVRFGPKFAGLTSLWTRLVTIALDSSSCSQSSLLCAKPIHTLTTHHSRWSTVRSWWLRLVIVMCFPYPSSSSRIFWFWAQSISSCVWFAVFILYRKFG